MQQAWATLAEHLELDERLKSEGKVEVDAPTLKRITGWEPRLLMKFDARSQRPEALRHAGIFPLRNGVYTIVAADVYGDLEQPERRIHFSGDKRARGLVTLPWDSVPSSESQALDMALASGMLRHFLGEDELALTIRGRLRCPAFEFQCRTHGGSLLNLQVDGVQTEVDAGLEGDSIHLVEAKLGWRSDFHVRQLYYPLRMWSLRSPGKPVTAVFCCYSDRLFHLWRYAFEPLEHYHGLQLVKSATYTFEPEEKPDLARALATTQCGVLPLFPFPQADSLTRVIDLLEASSSGQASPASLVERFGFTARQADYYTNAARFLGFLEPAEHNLSSEGAKFVAANRATRHMLLLHKLAELPIFRPSLETLERTGKLPKSGQLMELIAEYTTLSGATVARRAKTAEAWLNYVTGILGEKTRPEQQQLDF